MLLLSVETSTHTGALALFNDERLIAERILESAGRRHAQTLVQEASTLLAEHGCSVAGLQAIAVSVGPGSFTGLRVGVVFARTLAWVTGIPLLAVDTLQAIACQLSPDDIPAGEPLRMLVISDAQRNEVFVGDYEWDPAVGIWQRVGDVRIAAVGNLTGSPLIVGPAVTRHREQLEQSGRFRRCLELQPRAREVAAVGRCLLRCGQLANVADLEPVYIRPSYAEEKRASGAAGTAGLPLP
ncbi:MAG: t(6)A37 threonylcarbamoyladenosine biosynthesis protein [Planctomycetota bacterium]|jgi:tRNA threonylcarbamoyladenosine biosynthesis protein TsaB